jgi:hypothetical protein
MPHACIAKKAAASSVSRFFARPQRNVTHLCETKQDRTTYCGLTVVQVDDAEANCHPTRFGPVHGECEAACRRKHPQR